MDLESLNDSNYFELSEKAANQVVAKSLNSVDVLQSLGPFLTDKNLGKRKNGLSFLSQFLTNLPASFCDAQECEVFAKFYEDRINDHHSLIPGIIRGLDAIFRFENLRGDHLNALFRKFFTQIHVQSQVVNDRRKVFDIFQHLFTTKWTLQALKKLQSEVVLVFIQAVDAEKDPQNIKLIFSLWPIILKVQNHLLTF